MLVYQLPSIKLHIKQNNIVQQSLPTSESESFPLHILKNTQILNFKANFHTEFEPFFKKKNYANNGGHFNSLGSTGDTGRQPPLFPPQLAATRVDTIIHNYRPSMSP